MSVTNHQLSTLLKNLKNQSTTFPDLHIASDDGICQSPVQIKFDPLAIACYYYLKDNSYHTFEAAKQIAARMDKEYEYLKESFTLSSASFQMADDIRKYYTGKLTLLALTAQLSKFRKSLLTFLQRPIGTICESEVGMISKMPLFYNEDTVLDIFDEDVKQPKFNKNDISFDKKDISLSFLKKVYSSGNRVKYWFIDQNEFLCCIQNTADNQMLEAFEYILKTYDTIDLFANKDALQMTGRNTTYFNISNWTIK